MTYEDANNFLADAIWWLYGYSAAQSPDDTGNPVHGLGPSLKSVREWLHELPGGGGRIVGNSDRRLGVVISESELERMYDGLRGSPEDREDGLKVAKAVFERFSKERRDLDCIKITF